MRRVAATVINMRLTLQIKALQYKLAKEQQGRAEKNCKSTFVVGHWNGDSNCIMVPNHKNETAFQGYHTHNPYIETFNELVGGGDANVGASRILSVLIRKFPKEYLEEGMKKGMTMNTMFDEVAWQHWPLIAISKIGNSKRYRNTSNTPQDVLHLWQLTKR